MFYGISLDFVHIEMNGCTCTETVHLVHSLLSVYSTVEFNEELNVINMVELNSCDLFVGKKIYFMNYK